MHIGVLFYNIGGYHAARLRAVQGACEQRGWDLTAIQVTDQTGEHPWGDMERWLTFPVKTLLPQSSIGQGESTLFESADAVGPLHSLLESLHLDAIAIPGWGFPVSRAALQWCRRHHKPAILMSESKWDDAPRVWWKERWKSWRYVSRFDAALVGGKAHGDYLIRLGMAEERVFLGYDVVDNDYFAQGAAIACRCPAAARQRQPKIPPRPYFLAVTRLTPRKNVATLIRAYGIYYQLYGSNAMDLAICGSGVEEPALRALIHNEKLETSVHLPGFLSYDALPDWYALAAALIHPALQEQWGLVINEACAAGLPILCSQPVGACSELVQLRQNGLTFSPVDESAIAQCLIQFHQLDPSIRLQWGQQSQKAVARFSPTMFAEGLMQAIDCARSRPR